jgi:hypothetical protein
MDSARSDVSVCIGNFCRFTLFIAVFSVLGAGALVGPIIGGTLWRLTHRRTMALIEARDREFYRRIQKNRADPNSQSATNPVPDYYGTSSDLIIHPLHHFNDMVYGIGEKIGSLHGYRQVGKSCLTPRERL